MDTLIQALRSISSLDFNDSVDSPSVALHTSRSALYIYHSQMLFIVNHRSLLVGSR